MFLADLAVLTHMTSVFLPSTIAMCCLRLALRKVSNLDSSVPIELLTRKLESAILHSSISEEEVKHCAKDLFAFLKSYLHDPIRKTLLKNYA
jgi:Cyclin, C-terminal domain